MLRTSSTDILGTEKIGRLLLNYSLPSIVAMTSASLYNIIDRIFIGHGVGPLAISGLAITLPVMNIGIAFGSLVGVGAATLISIRLGEQRKDEALRILGNVTLLNIILGILYSVIMLIFLDPVLVFFGASEDTIGYARDFMEIILIINVISHSYFGFNNIMRSSGYPMKAMFTTLLTVGINTALAPLFIFVFHWGIRGAALATAVSQIFGFIYTVVHFSSKQNTVSFERGTFVLDKQIIADIFSIGMSPFVINLCSCLVIIIINKRLVQYGGDYTVGAYGIINSVLMFIIMIVSGLATGMQPIAGYNYGARRYDRVRSVFKYTVIAATCITTFGLIVSEIFPVQIARAFTDSRDIIEPTVFGLRILLVIFPFIGFYMVTSNFFQSIGRAKLSVVLALSRQTFFLVPGLIVLPKFWGVTGVWAAIVAADVASVLLAFAMYKTQIDKILSK